MADATVRRQGLPKTAVSETYRSPDAIHNMFLRVALRRVGGPGQVGARRRVTVPRGDDSGGRAGPAFGGAEPLSTLQGDSHVAVIRWDQKIFGPHEVERLRLLEQLAARKQTRLTQLERSYIGELHGMDVDASDACFEGAVIFTYVHNDPQLLRRHIARANVNSDLISENMTPLSRGVLGADGSVLAQLGVTGRQLPSGLAGGARVRPGGRGEGPLDETGVRGQRNGQRGGFHHGEHDAGDGGDVELDEVGADGGGRDLRAAAVGSATTKSSTFSVARWARNFFGSHQFGGAAGTRGLVSYAKVLPGNSVAVCTGSSPVAVKSTRVMEIVAAVDVPKCVCREVHAV